jgi:hypothetical protein
MESQTTTQKQELIDWISTIEDIEVLKELNNIKKHVTFNFDEEFKKGISSEEARKLSKDKIREWWGK